MPEHSSSNKSKVYKNISWLFFDKIYTKLIIFITGILVAKYLGAENYGVLNYYYAIVLLFKPLVNLGLESIIVKKIVEKKFPLKDTLVNSFLLKTFASLLLLTGFFTYTFLKVERPDSLLFNTLLLILLFQSFNVFDCFFQSIIKSKFTVVARIIAVSCSSILKITLIYNEAPLYFFAGAILIEHILIGVIQFGFFTKLQGGLKYHLDLKISKDLLSESWWLILASIPAVIYLRIDLVMLGKMSTMEQTGLYSLAVKFSEIFYFLPVIIVSSFQPILIKKFRTNLESFYGIIEYYIKLIAFLSVFIISLAVLLNELIFTVLFTNEFVGIDKVFIIHLMALPSVFLGYLFSKIFIIEEKGYFNLIISTSIALVNVVLNFFLIPKYGALGAAIATTISYFFRIIISLFNGLTFKIVIRNYKYILLVFIPIIMGYCYILDVYRGTINIFAIISAIISIIFLFNYFFERDKIR